MKRSAPSFAAALSLALLVTAPAFAQGTPDFSKVEIKTTQLAPDFWTLEGQGGTISVLSEIGRASCRERVLNLV